MKLLCEAGLSFPRNCPRGPFQNGFTAVKSSKHRLVTDNTGGDDDGDDDHGDEGGDDDHGVGGGDDYHGGGGDLVSCPTR